MIPVLTTGAAAPVASPAGPRVGARSFGAVLEEVNGRALRAAGAEPARQATPGGPRARPATPGCAQLLEAVDHARARLDGVLAAVRSGRTFTAQELLGLQAEAYRTVQTVDLGVKLVEQGAQAVRQTLATQV